VEFLRARREKRHALIISDPQPVADADDFRASAAQFAIIGIFIMMLGATLYFARPVLLPIVAAVVIGMTFAPIVKYADKRGMSLWLAAAVIVLTLVAAAATVVTLLSTPLIEWIDRAPEIAASIKQKLYVLDWPLAALRDLYNTVLPPAPNAVKVETPEITLVAPVVAAVTPAVVQVVIFAATLFFTLVGQMEVRRQLAAFFESRTGKLRFLRILNDIEHNLASYVAVVTTINLTLGAVVAFGAWLFGFANPVTLGILTAILNYLPYIGPACMVLILFCVGLVTFPTFSYALLPPAAFVTLTTIEGHIITPAILGRQLTLNPLLVFTAIVFWAWLWGPFGAFLAIPLSIIALVTFNHLFPSDDTKLPG
jgi:predicted PurR-regulated permease PerM